MKIFNITNGLRLIQKTQFFFKPGLKIPIICFPKSASTFTQNVLNEILKSNAGKGDIINPNFKLSLYQPKLIENYFKSGARHMHIWGRIANVKTLKENKIKPIILVRNIFDTIVSFKDHIEKIGFPEEGPYIIKNYTKFNEKEKIDYLINISLPWLLSFYSSWYDKKKDIDMLFIKYEDMISNKVKYFKKILKFYKININEDKIIKSIEKCEKNKKKINFNKGITGRGKSTLTKDQIEKIKKIAKTIKHIDFKLIGL